MAEGRASARPGLGATRYFHDYRLPTTESDHAVTMERVTGIGGVFFRAKDPETLSAWYDDTFGVSRAPRDYSTAPWMQRAGATVFAPFPNDTDYFGNPSYLFLMKLRAAKLDRFIKKPLGRGIAV